MASSAVESNDVKAKQLLSLQDTTADVKSIDLESFQPAICVICLDRITDEAVASPCAHDQFHFSCLGTWLQQSRACPLCKQEVSALRYRDSAGSQNIYHLTEEQTTRVLNEARQQTCRQFTRRQHRQVASENSHAQLDEAVAWRRRIYHRQQYSLYIGSNRISRYRNITAEMIRQDEALVAKAKKWIRRELAVFDFLDPDSTSFGRFARRATNAEYLLEYIVAIIKLIDIKASAGQAHELIKDFLGKNNARLFLHELESWLRSPFETLKDWDAGVQYPSS